VSVRSARCTIRGLVVPVFLIVLGGQSISAQVPRGTPPVRRPDTRSPIQLEDQWTTALVRRDTRTFDQLLAPNFVYTENATVMDRKDVIKSVTGSDRVDWARNEGMRIHNFGDVQIITGVLHLRGRGTSGAFDRRYQFTDTWQRRSTGWQIIAAHDYLIPG
jgi:ketosteroid isomerase-like protein